MLENLGSLTLFVIFMTFIRHVLYNLKLRKHLPPGPTGLPIVGYLPFLGNEAHKDIAKLGDIYGNVFTLQLGIHNVVVLNDWEAVRDALHKDAFLGRPSNSPFTFIGNSTSLIDQKGNVWRDQRRFAAKVLKETTFGKGCLEEKILAELRHLIRLIDGANGRPMNLRSLLRPSISNIMSELVFGHSYDYNHPLRCALDQMISIAYERFPVIGSLSMAPVWFSKLVLRVGGIDNKKQFDTVFAIFDDEIRSHEKSFNWKNRSNNYIDSYLGEMQLRQQKDPYTMFTKSKLNANCRLFFGAGNEPVRTTIEWALILVASNSDHQLRIQREIDSIVGPGRQPYWADRPHMSFTEAFMNEVFRWKTVFPLNLMRSSIDNSSILGHFIAKNTRILANIWAVHNDPKVWDNPRLFNPCRFLTDDGRQVIPVDALIPFSTGKRSCIGESMGRLQVFLYFVTLLQRYTVSVANGELLGFEDRFGLTIQPKDRVILSFQKRI
ncbi:cytochrome P450 2J6-like [Oppia nitens]|uniref:cytochrome P450 2J6-like n=1 Tax=Oppia nitens TaxID=1686743 RepID=UPI0023DB0023|nr:cytochrome P450 2J6-like [Oppia nitens]